MSNWLTIFDFNRISMGWRREWVMPASLITERGVARLHEHRVYLTSSERAPDSL